jgi:tetratricopeptide (TPR) repeat protein
MNKTVILLFASCVFAGADAGKPHAPLFDGLGKLHHPVTTTSKMAQRYFDQGLSLCYAFNHKEAIRSFEAAARYDTNLAMAWWGVAYAYGPHVNKPMSKEDSDSAWSALQRAVKLRERAGAKEQAYITALAARYQEKFVEDRSALDKAYAAAMRKVTKAYPDDLDAQTLLAEALMDTMPWDYWKSDRSPKPETEEANAALKYVMARNPDHLGANHLYIHAVEAGPQPELGLPSADRLLNYAPQAGHLVHMPSHIYMRVGQYEDAVQSNRRAIKADQSYIRQCHAQGFYPGAYYPHNIHFVWYAYLFQGRSGDAVTAASTVAENAMENYCGPKKAVEGARVRHLPWLTLARFGKWDDVLKVQEPAVTNDFLIDRVMWHYTRGLAFAARKQMNDAKREHAALTELVNKPEAKKLDSPQFPATAMLKVAEHLLSAKVAPDAKAAIAYLEKAVAAEEALPYMEPAYWPIPTRPILGAAVLQAGDAEKAEAIFREDLKRWPRNGFSLFGLEQALRKQGNTAGAELVRRELDEAWKRADVKLDLAWF